RPLQRLHRGAEFGAEGGECGRQHLGVECHHEGGQRSHAKHPILFVSRVSFLHRISPLCFGPVMRRFTDRTNGKRRGIRPEIISLRPNPFAGAGRLGVESRWFSYREPRENMMKRTLIRYKTKPDMADKNAELIAGVFAELKATKPEGLRYVSLRLDDDTFVHFVESETDSGSALLTLAAFKAFQSG